MPSGTPGLTRSTPSASWPPCGSPALRALASLGVVPDLVILDGNHDWLTAPGEVGLLAFSDDAAGPSTPPVTTMIKADLKCSSVAAASVLAKVERDDLMVGLAADHPAYGWNLNKGYAAPEHMDAIARWGRASCIAGRGVCRACTRPGLARGVE